MKQTRRLEFIPALLISLALLAGAILLAGQAAGQRAASPQVPGPAGIALQAEPAGAVPLSAD